MSNENLRQSLITDGECNAIGTMINHGSIDYPDNIFKQPDLEIIAGPCQIEINNVKEVFNMSEIRVADGRGGMQRAIWGARVVGLKSRTGYNSDGEGMGVDFPDYIREDAIILPDTLPQSVQWAKQIVTDTDLLVAAEIMIPEVQMPMYEKAKIPAGHFLAWNPSVNQLGWPVLKMAEYARRNGWLMGIKNGKNLNVTLEEAYNPNPTKITSVEKQWIGLASYARGMNGKLALIHRGVETPDKGIYRNIPVHEIARRVKHRVPEARLYFDPSHSLGPELRDSIVEETIRTMRMMDGNKFLYDGILVEVGTSQSDTKQHITVNELEAMAKELAHFRRLRTPDPVSQRR